MYSQIEKLASAVRNNVVAGLQGFHENLSLSDDLIEQAIVDERLQIIKEYSINGILPVKDLYISINCIPVDCQSIEKCRCAYETDCETETLPHFEIPQLLNDYGSLSVAYIGSVDKQVPFLYYTSPTQLRYHKYRKRGKNKPYVWIDTSPNENGMYDCFVFNAPLLTQVSITAIFKDTRQLRDLKDCAYCIDDDNKSFINNEIVKRCTEKFVRWYRALAPGNRPNDQSYQPG